MARTLLARCALAAVVACDTSTRLEATIDVGEREGSSYGPPGPDSGDTGAREPVDIPDVPAGTYTVETMYDSEALDAVTVTVTG